MNQEEPRAKRQLPGATSAQDETDADVGPCSSSSPPDAKRARYSSASAEQVPRFRHSPHVHRPGIPNPIELSAYKLADKPSPPWRDDDKEGHYNYELGENISSRYKILSKFGEGTFGRVLECWDRKVKDYVAVKIVRNVDKYRHAAMIELEVLNTLQQNDPESKRNCVRLKEWFQYRGHVCLVFEKLGPSLYDYLRRNEYQPLPLALVQAVARQVLEAVAYMHELGLVHTDLKPENILLVDQEHMRLPPVPPAATERRVPCDATLRVIDFGSATFDDGYHSTVISTRHYRAPEVILGLGWSYPCDLWSCGCILVELAVGDALFQTHENLEHLAMMQQVLGPIPGAMALRADKAASKFFVAAGSSGGGSSGGAWPRLAWPDGSTSAKSMKAVHRLGDLRSLLALRADQAVPGGGEAVEALAELIEGLLRYEPASRTTAVQALQHEFFRLQLDMPVGQGATPEEQQAAGAAPVAAAAAAAAGSSGQAAGNAGGSRQQLGAGQQQQQQQQPWPPVTGVSGSIAAEAVAARAARQAAAAAAAAAGSSGGGAGAPPGLVGGGGSSGGGAPVGFVPRSLHAAAPLMAPTAVAAAAGQQGLQQQQQQQASQLLHAEHS